MAGSVLLPRRSEALGALADIRSAPVLSAGDVKDDLSGFQVGLYNSAGGCDMLGLQAGLWNETGHIRGVQVGLVNTAGEARGLQVGLINRCETMFGYQIGLVNVIRDAELQFCPIVNIGF